MTELQEYTKMQITSSNSKPLYQTETANNYEEFRKLNWLLTKKKFVIQISFSVVLIMLFAFYALYIGYIWLSHNHHFKWWFGITPHRAIILFA